MTEGSRNSTTIGVYLFARKIARIPQESGRVSYRWDNMKKFCTFYTARLGSHLMLWDRLLRKSLNMNSHAVPVIAM